MVEEFLFFVIFLFLREEVLGIKWYYFFFINYSKKKNGDINVL